MLKVQTRADLASKKPAAPAPAAAPPAEKPAPPAPATTTAKGDIDRMQHALVDMATAIKATAEMMALQPKPADPITEMVGTIERDENGRMARIVVAIKR